MKRSNAIARKAKNGSSNHGEPFFLAPPDLPKGEDKEKKPLPGRGVREKKMTEFKNIG
ncbi:MAG: hypothetical protein ACOC1D_04940 [Prolixibacteraceae bacterium]